MLYHINVRTPREKIEEKSPTYLVFEDKQSFELICLNTQGSVVPKSSLSRREGLFQIVPVCLYCGKQCLKFFRNRNFCGLRAERNPFAMPPLGFWVFERVPGFI